MQKKNYPDNWKEISNRIRVLRNHKCEYCKTKGKKNNRLTVHHLDYDTRNNLDSNLVLLCQKCHLHIQQKYPGVRKRKDFTYLFILRDSQLELF